MLFYLILGMGCLSRAIQRFPDIIIIGTSSRLWRTEKKYLIMEPYLQVVPHFEGEHWILNKPSSCRWVAKNSMSQLH